MTALLIAIVVAAAYLLGSIPFGLIVSKSQGIDIREHGSKNIGATNVWRVMGKKFGLLTFVCDAAKGWLAVTLAMWLARHWAFTGPRPFDQGYAGIAGAMGCIIGHNFPVWLRFKGGKGVATSLGVIVGMMPLAAAIAFALWAVVFKITRYVSLASILAAMALPVIVAAMRFAGRYGDAYFYFATAAGLLVIVRHIGNMKRLIAGTESRFGAAKPETSAAKTSSSETSPKA